ncbi:MAG: PepSY-associated TM helix domain-containing protein [Dokdonella sp.]
MKEHELIARRSPIPNTGATTIARTRSRTMRFIRQLHLWIGAWGALAAILYGSTGFMQNHRAVLKLPQGQSVELSKIELPVPEAARASPEALREWLTATQGFAVDNMRVQPPSKLVFNGQDVTPPARWTFSGGNARISWMADYSVGNATLQLRNTEQSPLVIMSRLHKSIGGGLAWTFLGDSFALAMVLLGISGLMLWARGRSARQMIFSIVGLAVVVVITVVGMAVT